MRKDGIGHPTILQRAASCQDLRAILNRGSIQPEHVLHTVKTGLLPGEPAGGAERAIRKSIAAVGAVNELDTLADAAEDDGMLADDVAGANGKKRDLFFAALTDDALSSTDGDGIELAFQPVRNSATQRQRSAARCVFFESVGLKKRHISNS